MEVTEIFGMLGTPSLGRVCVADSPQTRSYLIRPNLAALGQTVWAQVRGPKKLWGCGAPPQWDAGAWLPPWKYASLQRALPCQIWYF